MIWNICTVRGLHPFERKLPVFGTEGNFAGWAKFHTKLKFNSFPSKSIHESS